MRSTSQKRSRLALESLETRDTPAGLWSVESFDAGPTLPADWDVTSTGDLRPSVSAADNSGATGALTLPPGTRTWEQSVLPADAGVMARVRIDGTGPVQLSSVAETCSPPIRPTTPPRLAATDQSASRRP